MGKDLWEASAAVKELFQCAADTTGMDVKKLLFEGTEEELKQTDKTQVAVTLVNLSAGIVLKERGIVPDGCAGFSLGEYAALVEAGVLTKEAVFPLVKLRGELMEKTARSLNSGGGAPGMAAVIGLAYEKLEEAIRNSGRTDVFIANYNSPVQTVLSGTAEGLAQAETFCKEAGAKRVIRLKVSAPFHCPLLEDVRAEFGAHLAKQEFRDPKLPLYSNVTGKRVNGAAEAKDLCMKQVVSPVRWVDEERQLIADGFTRCMEVGPGTVLAGLWKAVSEELPCLPAGTLAAIQNV